MSNQVKNHIVLGRETTWGTPVTPDKTLPVNFTGGLQTLNDVQFVNALKSELAMNYDAFIGNRTHAGDYEMAFYPDWIGYLLLSAFGGLVTTEPEPSVVYDHRFRGAEVKPSLTIEQKIGENVRRYAGAIVQQIGISLTPSEVVTLTATIMAKGQAFEASPVTPAPTTISPFNFAQALLYIDGNPIEEIQNLEITYNNNLGFKHTLGSNDPAYQYLGASQVTGSAEMYLDNTTLALYNNYIDKDFVQVELVITGDTIGASSNYGLVVEVPKAVITSAETPLADDYNLLTLEFEGVFDVPSGGYLCEMSLTNLTPTYT